MIENVIIFRHDIAKLLFSESGVKHHKLKPVIVLMLWSISNIV